GSRGGAQVLPAAADDDRGDRVDVARGGSKACQHRNAATPNTQLIPKAQLPILCVAVLGVASCELIGRWELRPWELIAAASVRTRLTPCARRASCGRGRPGLPRHRSRSTWPPARGPCGYGRRADSARPPPPPARRGRRAACEGRRRWTAIPCGAAPSAPTSLAGPSG